FSPFPNRYNLQAITLDGHMNAIAVLDRLGDQEISNLIVQLALNDTAHWTSTVGRLVAGIGNPVSCVVIDIERNALGNETLFRIAQLHADNLAELLGAQRVEQQGVVNTVEELWTHELTHPAHYFLLGIALCCR